MSRILVEPPVSDDLPSPLLMGDGGDSSVGATEAASTGGCPNSDPDVAGTKVTRPVSVGTARRFGLSDQSAYRDPGTTFSDPRAEALNLSRARLILPYDIVHRVTFKSNDANSPACADYTDARQWIIDQLDTGRSPLITFEHSYRTRAQKTLPNTDTYKRDIQEFMEIFPAVKEYTAWNEPNNGNQPTYGTSHAKQAGEYWRAANSACGNGDDCVAVAGGFTDESTLNRSYFNRYHDGMGKGPGALKWAIGAYGAINGDDEAADRIRTFLNWAPVRGKDVYIIEAGVFAGNDEDIQASKLDDFLFSDSSSIFFEPQIKRFYYYEWHGKPDGFDTGLVGPTGSHPTRKVYCVFQRKTNPGNPSTDQKCAQP